MIYRKVLSGLKWKWLSIWRHLPPSTRLKLWAIRPRYDVYAHNNPSLQQLSFRGRKDNVTLNSTTFDDPNQVSSTNLAINTNFTVPVADTFRIRFEIQEAGGASENVTFHLYVSHNGGTYQQVTTSSTIVRAVASGQYADDDTTTNVLANGTGTFATGYGDENGAAPSAGNVSLTASGHTEVEFCLQIQEADVADTDTLTFEVRRSTGALNAYNVRPVATVSKSGTTHNLAGTAAGAASATGALSLTLPLSASAPGAATATGVLSVPGTWPVIQSQIGQATAGNSATVIFDSATTSGNLVLLFAGSNDNSGIDAISGWTKDTEVGPAASGQHLTVWRKAADGTTMSTTVASGSGANSNTRQLIMVEFDVAHADVQFDTSATNNAASAVSLALGSITPASAPAAVFAGVNLANSSGGSEAFTNGYELINISTNTRIFVGEIRQTGSPSSTSTTISWTTARNAAGLIASYVASASIVTLAGAASGAATATGALAVTKTLTGTGTGTATATGALSVTLVLAGTATGAATATAELDKTIPFSVSITGSATATGVLVKNILVDGAAAGAATATGALSVTKALVGSAVGTGTATAELDKTISFSVSISGAATATATLGAFRNLTGSIAGVATVGSAYAERILRDDPVAYWRLGDTSGTTAVDETGNHDGTYEGGYTQNITGTISGDADKAVDFDGTNGAVEFGSGPGIFGGTSWTVEGWVNRDTSGTEDTVYAEGTTAGGFIYISCVGTIISYRTSSPVVDSLSNVPNGEWTHFAFTRSGNTVSVYINGELDNSGTAAPTLTADHVAIGHLHYSASNYAPLDGKLDDISTYDYALDAATIAQHYDLGKNGPKPQIQILQLLSGSAAGVGTATATLSTAGTVDLIGAADGAATATGSLSITRGLVGSAEGVATATAELDKTVPFSVSITGAGTATAELDLTLPLTASTAGQATASGVLSLVVNLAASIAGVATATATLNVGGEVDLTGSTSGAAVATGALSVVKTLTASIAGEATATAVTSILKSLVGAVNGVASADASITLTVGLSATASGATTLDGNLTRISIHDLVTPVEGKVPGRITGAAPGGATGRTSGQVGSATQKTYTGRAPNNSFEIEVTEG